MKWLAGWLVLGLMTGCSITRIEIHAGGCVSGVNVEQPRQVDVTPSLQADGNDVSMIP